MTIDAPEGEIQLLGSVTEHTVVRAGADACDRLQPTRADHVHTTVDLSTAASTQAVTVSPTDTSPSILFHAGDAWRLDGARVSGPLLDNLQPGLVYRIAHKGVPGDCHVVLLGEQVDAAWAPRPYVEAL
ncbi:hypothetical protein JOF29_005909 [Kribbella aluminosa]|uniref:Uncharacterized protein n=1 Tax=Kribbella aluminosa TaxID=416017 RepID=A0ABS4UT28_9ACTN|nr:hypothetical protein [Kribbella aluminosa]MBP2354799.1 hypothetical protein [Kribbella aluminosa]